MRPASTLEFRFHNAHDVEEDDDGVFGQGFRFGGCLVCATPKYKQAISSSHLHLNESGGDRINSKSLRVHTRFVSLEEEQDMESTLIGMFLNETEEDLFHDFARERYTLQANIGTPIFVRHPFGTYGGNVVERERSNGNFLYMISISGSRDGLEGSPVFAQNELLGILVRVFPGMGLVYGLEPLTRQTTHLFFDQSKQQRAASMETYRALLNRSKHDDIREALHKMNLFVQDHDWNMS